MVVNLIKEFRCAGCSVVRCFRFVCMTERNDLMVCLRGMPMSTSEIKTMQQITPWNLIECSDTATLNTVEYSEKSEATYYKDLQSVIMNQRLKQCQCQ